MTDKGPITRVEARAHRRRIRDSVIAIVALAFFGGWFLLDGTVWYPAENRAAEQANERGRTENPDFVPEPLPNSESEIFWQKVLAGVCGLVAAAIVPFVIRARRHRIVVDGNGLHIDRQAPIVFSSMTAFHTDRWDEKGWVDLEYEQGGRTRRVRLDSFRIEPFEPIVEAIAQQTDLIPPGPRRGPDTPMDA